MHLDRFWNLLSKHLAGEASMEEVAELESLIKARPDLSYPAQHLTDLWKLPPAADAEEAAAAYKKLAARLQEGQVAPTIEEQPAVKHPKRPRPFFIYTIAAVTVLALAFGFWTSSRPDKKVPGPEPSAQASEVATRTGSRTRVVLPDSSVVWLNSGSRLTYDPAFNVAHRNVTLSGEAFFDVKKKSLPFIIRAHGVQVKVLGTVFNVKSYPNEERTETTLLRGRVEVLVDKRPGEKFILKPNEKLSILDRRPVLAGAVPQAPQPVLEWSQLNRTPSQEVVETAWVENKLIFQDESLAEVARKMERWYNVSITITDSSLASLRVGGGPFENESIVQALEALQIAFDFNFKKRENQILITR